MFSVPVRNVVVVETGENYYVQSTTGICMYTNVTTLDLYFLLPYGSFFFLNSHLFPTGFLPACNTFFLCRINQYLRFKKLFTYEISGFFHHYFSVPFKASSITFDVFKSPLNSSEFNENNISSFNYFSYTSTKLGKYIRS